MERAISQGRSGSVVTCVAHPVQGLVCAHGYADVGLKSVPVESVFAAINAFETHVRFSLQKAGKPIAISCNGRSVPPDWSASIRAFIRRSVPESEIAYQINIRQNYRSGIGVGSSGAIYGALARCLVRIFELDPTDASALARLGSYSAAAATTGGISVVRSGARHLDNVAETICPADEFPFRMVVVPVDGEKQSRDLHEDMPRSLFYEPWLHEARRVSKYVVAAIVARDWQAVGTEVERYMYTNFAAMITGPRNLLPWRPTTMRRLLQLAEIRSESRLPFFIGMNSGPAIFAYTKPRDLEPLLARMHAKRIPCLSSEIGGGVRDDDAHVR